MRGVRELAVALVAFVASRAFAVCDSTDACLHAIEESQRSTRAVSARFEQTKHLSLMNEPLVSRGQFAFKQPDQVLWQIEEPAITVRIDRTGVHLPNIPNAEAEVAALGPFSNMMRELSGVFTGSLGTVRKTFDVRAEGDERAIHVHLMPRNAEWQRMFRSVALSFALPDLTMKSIHIDEALGDSLDIIFTDVHRNDAAAEAAFDSGATVP